MAQTGFTLSDEGRTISVLNDSGTTAITAGDIVYSAANNDVLTGTAASARGAYAIGDIKVKTATCSDDAYKTVVGVALEDIPAAGYGSIAMEGVFIHAAQADTEAGDALQVMVGDGTTTVIAHKVVRIANATTTVTAAVSDARLYKVGKALTGGSADGKYIIWKLSL